MEVQVVVKIPQGSRNKYEMDHARGVIRLDRMLFTSTAYPLDYGFIPDTLAEDGDPLDALVILEEPTFPGCLVLARPVGVFWMADEHGLDAKILTVPGRDPRYAALRDLADVPAFLIAEVGHFFDIRHRRGGAVQAVSRRLDRPGLPRRDPAANRPETDVTWPAATCMVKAITR